MTMTREDLIAKVADAIKENAEFTSSLGEAGKANARLGKLTHASRPPSFQNQKNLMPKSYGGTFDGN